MCELEFNENFCCTTANGLGPSQPPSKREYKHFLEAQINRKEYTLHEKKGSRFTAEYWKTFRTIQEENTIEVKNFICCSKCKRVLTYNPSINGTKHINEHYKACQNDRSLNRFVKKTTINFTTFEKDLITEAVAKFCCKDLRPFYAVECEGFMDVIEAIGSICAQRGSLSRDSLSVLLPCANTVGFYYLMLCEKYTH